MHTSILEKRLAVPSVSATTVAKLNALTDFVKTTDNINPDSSLQLREMARITAYLNFQIYYSELSSEERQGLDKLKIINTDPLPEIVNNVLNGACMSESARSLQQYADALKSGGVLFQYIANQDALTQWLMIIESLRIKWIYIRLLFANILSGADFLLSCSKASIGFLTDFLSDEDAMTIGANVCVGLSYKVTIQLYSGVK